MKYNYKPSGVCPASIDFEIEDGRLKNVSFLGGCDGNLKGIASLVDNMPVEEVKNKLSGISCGLKKTSCGDQLARALKEATE